MPFSKTRRGESCDTTGSLRPRITNSLSQSLWCHRSIFGSRSGQNQVVFSGGLSTDLAQGTEQKYAAAVAKCTRMILELELPLYTIVANALEALMQAMDVAKVRAGDYQSDETVENAFDELVRAIITLHGEIAFTPGLVYPVVARHLAFTYAEGTRRGNDDD